MKRYTYLYLILFIILFQTSFASNIWVTNGTLTGHNYTEDYCLIQFDLYWEASWRTSTTAPYNHDAAWIFMKYRYPGGDWQHLNPCTFGYVAPASATIDIPADSTGAFIYRSTDGEGSNTWEGMALRWNYGEYGIPDEAAIEIKIFAIEMVYVPQGAFYLGDTSSSGSFHEVGTPNVPYYADGSSIQLGSTTGNLNASDCTGAGMSGTTISSSYPSGYDAFYCMKYEASQDQYIQFLNTLTRNQQNTRTASDVSGTSLPADEWYVMTSSDDVEYRNVISCSHTDLGTITPIEFYGDYFNFGVFSLMGLQIPVNEINWMDLAAYADWAGLRPMTEGEFEKACRGPNASVPDELAWGNTAYHSSLYTLNGLGQDTEIINDLGWYTGNLNCLQSSASFDGPFRCGIFAHSAMVDPNVGSTRMETGSTYYGIMEMSGNLFELTVAMLNQAGVSFQGDHGDGELLPDGNANVDYWPGINGNTDHDTPNTAFSGTGVTDDAGSISRGGSELRPWYYCNVSYRECTLDFTYRVNDYGIRLVRTAP